VSWSDSVLIWEMVWQCSGVKVVGVVECALEPVGSDGVCSGCGAVWKLFGE